MAVKENTAMRQEVAHILMSLGISPSTKGYRCLLDGILYLLNNPERCFLKLRAVYDYLSDIYKQDPIAIERNIRTAVEIAWAENTRLWQDTFGVYLRNGAKPSNGFFLATFVELYRLDMLCCYEEENE